MKLVPPAMLAQMVGFTKRDYEATRRCLPFLPNHFDFMVAASLTPALDEEDLLAKVELDYDRHGGLREINYDELDESIKKRLEQFEYAYIGKYKNEDFMGNICDCLVIVINNDNRSSWIGKDINEDVNELLASFD